MESAPIRDTDALEAYDSEPAWEGPAQSRLNEPAPSPDQGLQGSSEGLQADTPSSSLAGESYDCTGSAPAPELELQWVDGPSDESSMVVANGKVVARLQNLADSDAHVEVFATLDFGGMETMTIPVDAGVLASGADRDVALDLEQLEQIGSMKYSGMVRFWAVKASTREIVTLKELYFHPAAGKGLHVYSERVLREQFRSGDYKGLLADLVEEGVVTARIVDASNAPTVDNDGLEADLQEEG